jgi:hypothetical protein
MVRKFKVGDVVKVAWDTETEWEITELREIRPIIGNDPIIRYEISHGSRRQLVSAPDLLLLGTNAELIAEWGY